MSSYGSASFLFRFQYYTRPTTAVVVLLILSSSNNVPRAYMRDRYIFRMIPRQRQHVSGLCRYDTLDTTHALQTIGTLDAGRCEDTTRGRAPCSLRRRSAALVCSAIARLSPPGPHRRSIRSNKDCLYARLQSAPPILFVLSYLVS